MSSAQQDNIIYEHPLNEKMRTLLRLEHLLLQVNHHLPDATVWSTRATVSGLLDMLSVFSRADIKADLIKELDRQREKLAGIRRTPGIDSERLDQILQRLEQATDGIYKVNGQIGQQLRGNEFLKTILQRSSIPGGSCAFDLPAYHYWLQLPYEKRQTDLVVWMQTLEPILTAVTLILSLVRGSSDPTEELASGGLFQRSLDPQTPAQMVRVGLPRGAPLYAEISGGKHRFNIRFLDPADMEHPAQTPADVHFFLNTCIL